MPDSQISHLFLEVFRNDPLNSFPTKPIMEFFGASRATLWIYNPDSVDEFVLVELENYPELEGKEGIISFLLHESILFNAMKQERREDLLFIRISDPRLREWRLTKWRQDLHQRCDQISFIPLPAGEGSFIGFLILYGRDMEYADYLSDDVKLLFSILGRTMSHILEESRRAITERRKIGHEVARFIENATSRIRRLQKLLRSHKKPEQNWTNQLLTDVIHGLETARVASGEENFREAILKRRPLSPWIDLREKWLESAHLVISQFPRSRVNLIPMQLPDIRIFVKIHSIDLDLLFSNLVSNAAKYSVPGGSILTEVRFLPDSMTFRISNLSFNLEVDELEVLWRFGVRGSNSKDRDGAAIDGDGVGLAVVSDICSVYGLEPTIAQRHINDAIWTDLKITFPLSLVSYKHV